MYVLIASDKFKDALSAKKACEAIEKGIRKAGPTVKTTVFPMADGGNGTAEILTYHSNGKMISHEVHDPLGRIIKSRLGVSGDGKTAFIEMAAASGLELLKPEERQCVNTSTFGTGELIAKAISLGVSRIIMGIGGSATNDGGTGMAAALGYRFRDASGEELEPVGKNLLHIASIDDCDVLPALKNVTISIACDVSNPLYGPNGAAFTYAAQKGATDEEVVMLDNGLRHLAQLIKNFTGLEVDRIPGAGAAGGLGAGAVAFLGASLEPGIELVMKQTQFETILREADVVITGEGKIDRQTLQGKVISGIAKLANKYNIPVIALGGQINLNEQEQKDAGISFMRSIQDQQLPLDQAISQTYENLVKTSMQMMPDIKKMRENKP